MLAADIAAAETIEALRPDADAALPEIASERPGVPEGSEPTLSPPEGEPESVASPESAAGASNRRHRRRTD
jgi:hypothetical protein